MKSVLERNKMKKIIRKIETKGLSLLNQIIPKKRKIFFYGGSVLKDNTEALFRYVNENTEFDAVCVADKTMQYDLRPGVQIKKVSTMNILYELMTSKVLVDSFLQRFRIKPAKNQVSLQLWHGSPLKCLNKTKGLDYGSLYTHIFIASDLFREEMLSSFETVPEKLVLNGNPRNDDLFRSVDLKGFDLKKTNVIWMPTYRHGLKKEETKKDIPILDRESAGQLNAALERLGIKLFVKPHPLQKKAFDDYVDFAVNKNIVLLTDEHLRDAGIPLYSFLGQMDALITDYSSVYFDYLLLDRPIGFAIDDMDEYGENRGFVFDNPLDYMPGEKIYSLEDFISFFEHLTDGTDAFREERKRVNNLVNVYQDAGNCERCVKIIQEALERNDGKV